ncbi:MAG: pantoate--beta-alanine ligase [Actinobacteria bacterium]|jgi:pantoate--beta-alanine ligase|nr:pantoate--beta-alanine ligase [Actinomycetota bacterium]MBT3688208.1 pantoate--beta-alanine ligase [Actinomycetota bacterium]MBT4037163.1 pantoate--beta-alanine ligase [Actinomycetota bacterium]MBT4278191.1 pantoate--beta-alanine ligase [Actinomycetota bacterium]MBT4343835.1 pantoate--beta-alanine ligase [Actinomycetota bacterium]
MTDVEVVATVEGLRSRLEAERAAGRQVGLVPTMGFLHAGHASLIDAAVAGNNVTVVSVFVNPLQFAPDEDLADYPRDPEADMDVCGRHGADLVFAPSVAQMYPEPGVPEIEVGDLASRFEGASRPTHFGGVAMAVSRLFDIVGTSRAYFGEKDFQQLAVVRQMVADHGVPVEVVGCPTVREHDGLALSSRNAYLTAAERREAPVLRRALLAGTAAVAGGEADPGAVASLMAEVIGGATTGELDYAAVIDPDTFEAPPRITRAGVRLLVACRFGRARLIDNMAAVPT